MATGQTDTIAAAATPKGESAIAMIRISGPACLSLCKAIFNRQANPEPRHSYHASYQSQAGDILDDVIYCYFQEPNSFSGEDTLEISCHGNPLIVARVLEDLIARGCRTADPGEFTRRAFLNGRIDLTQAEAVMELIQARSDKAIQAANNQLKGAFGRQLGALKDDLINSIAFIEAYIDFPEEDLPKEQKAQHIVRLQRLIDFCSRLIDSSKYGAFLRDGVKTLILGEPNAGKSSLLNCLLGFERAIVSEEPGTTRDFLRERIIIGPHSIQLMDTAGLREAETGIEMAGIRKTIELTEEADIFLLVLDATLPCPALPDEIRQRLNPGNCIVLQNKADLGNIVALDAEFQAFPNILISALNRTGIDTLKTEVMKLIDSSFSSQEDDLILVNARHSEALKSLLSCLVAARDKLESEDPAELIASDMRGALDAIGSILGRIDNEAMLDRLFSTFCIGK